MFILVDEGAYSDLLDKGDLSDAKLFFEGRGKALKHKILNGRGMTWIGVPIILAVNELHKYMEKPSDVEANYLRKY